jgi:hypothetical protein
VWLRTGVMFPRVHNRLAVSLGEQVPVRAGAADIPGAVENRGTKVLHDPLMFRRAHLPVHQRRITALLRPTADAAAEVTIEAAADRVEGDDNKRILTIATDE